ncbi:hypothetical protein [Thalassobacillus hwangdonensis]|uniref:Uncharacterized protein n=1 Tax=Thalassobacillus hwangdonensis TaxID=546108 RepID=A0ABW3L7M9_9BACI
MEHQILNEMVYSMFFKYFYFLGIEVRGIYETPAEKRMSRDPAAKRGGLTVRPWKASEFPHINRTDAFKKEADSVPASFVIYCCSSGF